MSEALISRDRVWCMAASAPPFSIRAELCCPAATIRQPGYLLTRRPVGFAPPPRNGFAFLAAHTDAPACPTSTRADESPMNFEGVGVVFSTDLLFSAAFLHVGGELRRERSCPVFATEQAATGRSGGRALGGAIIRAGIISVLCMAGYEPPTLYIRQSAV